ncbi:MAG: ABC transporter ATP-binding protein [Pseudomonadales bacterium]|nr:ABC transporter ATP-binding protein [Pseudomonadales bacterium]MBO6563772.1 ABC transporter ATP-binding protein [Pseudomonadales bacterium]MBO6595581.1 ABC transporter ATP-binding protein [Pseudomonadales bacterium]MBO6702081.1 ABC transporter ATP-binding protein [Pseudomonadales bacterium]MBO6820861.1 ABC transporter ATP-binding protein [Pseudomonadales bacterium]
MSDVYFDDENYHDGFDDDSYHQGMNLDLWKKLLGYALHYKKEVAILATCAFFTAVCEIAYPLITKSVIDAIAADGVNTDLSFYAWLYLFFTILLGFSIGGFITFGGKIRTHVAHDIRMDGFCNLQALSFSYYDFRPVGWLMARMTSDCERLSNILAWGMLDLVWSFTMMIGIAIAMLWMDASLGLIVMSVLPVLAWISIKFQHRILKSARIVRKTNSRITGSYNESIMGVQTSKAFVKEAENLKNFGELTDQMHSASVLNLIQAALYLPIVLTLGSVAIGLALVFGGLEVIWGTITAGTMVAFLAYARHFFEPIEQLAAWFAEMQMAQASAERIMSLVMAEPDIRDSDDVVAAMHEDKKTNAAIDGYPDEINQITFDDVSFSYEIGDPVLKNVNLTIDQGETLAIVGSTGGGKSTLVSLLCRFYEPTEGRILINDIDYKSRSLQWLQSNLGIVLQSSHIFGGSILENIRYGNLEATDDEVFAASRKAGAHVFIEAMKDGYQTSVGEGGSKLSAGQKQLISFARAILADPKILIMDEATSSVDTETEQQIQEGLDNLLSGRIALVIAHRLSTIRHADRILVIEHGEITESGSHDALMSVQGRYYRLYTQQSLAEFADTEAYWQK